jgi:uncharacterized protein YndB with AHSA1/START domain
MTMPTPETLTLVRTLQAPAQEVFRAWTDPALLNRWMSIPGAGTAVIEADPRVGGRFRMQMTTADGQVYLTTGVYREVEPGRRLVHTWKYDGPYTAFVGHETLLTVELRELGPDLTELTLRHELAPSEDYLNSIRGGWTALLDHLEKLYAEDRRVPAGSEA